MSPPRVYDPFNTKTKDKMQDRVPPSIFPPPSAPGKQSSLQMRVPGPKEDYDNTVKQIFQDGRRDQIQRPLRNPFQKGSPGMEINPGNYYTPNNKGLGFPPNRVI